MFGQYADRLYQTRPPPPSGQPPRFVFTRFYRSNLRPVIIGIGTISAIYALLWGGSSFSNIHVDKSQGLGNLVPFDVALGAAYMVVAAVEIFGIISAVKQSIPATKLYSMLSLLVSILVFGAELLRIVIHFKFKQEMIDQCTSAVQTNNGEQDNYFGWFGGNAANNLSPQQASDFCHNAWSHNTFSDIAWLIVSLICSLVFASLAYSYYRQLLDPSSGAARSRPQAADNVPLDTFRNYGQYNDYAEATGLPYNARGRASPPASEYAPPYEPSKLPGYGGGPSEMGDPDKKNLEEVDLGTSH